MSKGVESANLSKEGFASHLTQVENQYFIDKDELVVSYHSSNLPSELFEDLFQLLENNMKEKYKKSNIGWNRKDKRAEMKEDKMRFIVARDLNGIVVGFCSFQFDYEPDTAINDETDREVVYCYELQVSEKYTGKGLGGFLMRNLENIALFWQIPHVMLTVFKGFLTFQLTILTQLLENSGAIRFYYKIGFKPDYSSPSQCLPQVEALGYDYEILIKSIALESLT